MSDCIARFLACFPQAPLEFASNVAIGGFQFQLSLEPLGNGFEGGAAVDSGFTIVVSQVPLVLAFSFSGDEIAPSFIFQVGGLGGGAGGGGDCDADTAIETAINTGAACPLSLSISPQELIGFEFPPELDGQEFCILPETGVISDEDGEALDFQFVG